MKSILIIYFLLLGFSSFAQETLPVKDKRLDSMDSLLSSFDPQSIAITQDSLTNLSSSHRRWNDFVDTHRIRAFTWQHNSGIIIFFLVILIVLFGIYLSYYQFRLGKKMILKQMEINEKLKTSDQHLEILTADLQINKDGVKISTAVIGLAILVISVVFFFLYLKYVYPLHEI